MRTLAICFFLIFCVNGLFAKRPTAFVDDLMFSLNKPSVKKFVNITKDAFFDRALFSKMFPQKTIVVAVGPETSTNLPYPALPLNFVVQNFGMVCKAELKMQKQIKFPLYIRMGSKDYVDAIEGKNLPRH